MSFFKFPKKVVIDGRTGEGGGQVIRISVALASLTGTALEVDHVRGNRPGKRGGGLKAQHSAAINHLAKFSQADITGCTVGSKSMRFLATSSPADLTNRDIKIKADSAASILLVFQCILPFLVFAGDDNNTTVTLTIQGGTNVSFSLSFEYLDQVLLPALELFGIKVDRKLESRGWSHGTPQIGSVKLEVTPIPLGSTLRAPSWPTERGDITKIDISMVVPKELLKSLEDALRFELDLVFPGVTTEIVLSEDSGHKARMYTLLVAHTSTGLRFGRDCLYEKKVKDRSADTLSTEIAQMVTDELDREVRKGALVDEYLQDQMLIYQALAEGKSRIPGSLDEDRNARTDNTDKPFGDGSTHTITARWVISQLIPQVKWSDNGRVCEGIGYKVPEDTIAKLAKNLQNLGL